MKQKFIAEFLGSVFLLAIIVGSGIMGEVLAGGNNAVALLANSIATGAGLFVLIHSLAAVSGAHLNPVVTLVERWYGRIDNRTLVAYWIAQFLGSVAGVHLAHLMFQQRAFQVATKARTGLHLALSEFVATFALLALIALVGKRNAGSLPLCVAAYITSAYWFTSSTSFANPAVTVARTMTDTFCGIAPQGVLPFVTAQFLAAAASFALLRHVRETHGSV